MTCGEIWWVDFGLAYGSMPQGRRPAVIVQNDNFNASHIMTTVGHLEKLAFGDFSTVPASFKSL